MKKLMLLFMFLLTFLLASYIKTNYIVTDTQTGLMWQDDYTDNNGNVKKTNWYNAISYCNDLDVFGYDDWRLPNVNELASITDITKGTEPGTIGDVRAISDVFNLSLFSPLGDTPWFWTSTTHASNTMVAWGVCFLDGHISPHDKVETHRHVRCVRDQGGNTSPTADAGPDKAVQVNHPITLSGSGSSDSDGTIVSYQWKKQSNDEVLANTATFDFTPTGTATKTLVLTVTDDDGATASDTMILTVTDASGNFTIDNAALQKAIASIYDNTPYTPAIDIQGVIDASGLVVTVPYTVTHTPTTLEAYSTSVTLDASVTQDGETGIVATLSWAEQTNLGVGSGTFTATITIDDSAGNNNGIYNAKQLDIENNSAGLVAALFEYATDNVGGTGVLTLKIMPGIPDCMFGVVDNSGNSTSHEFLYLPVINTTTGKTWLSNNLGANYANINHSAFDPTQQAKASNDHNAYGSLFQWGRKADGHELINWRSGAVGTGVHGTTTKNSDDPAHALFIPEPNYPYNWRITQDDTLWAGESSPNNVCPIGYRLPTSGELDEERRSWRSNDPAGALSSKLKLPMPGKRNYSKGDVVFEGTNGIYWGSAVSGELAQRLRFNEESGAFINYYRRAYGNTVRCIKD